MIKSTYFKIAIVVVVISSIFIVPMYNEQEKKFSELREEKMRYEKELKEVQAELNRLEKELKSVDTPEVKEKMAREKLGMVKKDEIQYSIKKDKTLEFKEKDEDDEKDGEKNE